MPKQPEKCETMAEVREGVDAVDRDLVALLARRFEFMKAAARIKPDRDDVRDEPRKSKVIAAVMKDAKERGLPETVLAQMWEVLVEGSIAYEFVRWDDHARGK